MPQESPESEEEEQDNTCPVCLGTGIGQHGDPDTSICYNCWGSGEQSPKQDDPREPDDYYYNGDD